MGIISHFQKQQCTQSLIWIGRVKILWGVFKEKSFFKPLKMIFFSFFCFDFSECDNLTSFKFTLWPFSKKEEHKSVTHLLSVAHIHKHKWLQFLWNSTFAENYRRDQTTNVSSTAAYKRLTHVDTHKRAREVRNWILFDTDSTGSEGWYQPHNKPKISAFI